MYHWCKNFTAVNFDCCDIMHYRHGVSEFLTCFGKNTAAVNAVEYVFARQLPAVTDVPKFSSEADSGHHEITRD